MMPASGKIDNHKATRIDDLDVTTDKMTSRGGLCLFIRYLESLSIITVLAQRFRRAKRTAKGTQLTEIIKQIILNFVDGTSRHMSHFDHLRQDEGYAAGIESQVEELISSHTAKRFFKAFTWAMVWLFRSILQQLFLWRLTLARPEIIILGLDGMVLDNDEAAKRHGVQPTYRKVKGFHPLQLTWERFIVDAIFRGGKKHDNHGEAVIKMLRHVVANIRIYYRGDVPIVLRMDSGFFDQKIFHACEAMQIGYISGGRLVAGIKAYVQAAGPECFQVVSASGQTWDYLEFGDKAGTWNKYRRAIFCRPRYEQRQGLLEFARADTVLYTNLGMGQPIDEQLTAMGGEKYFEAAEVIKLYHGRGRDELIHRALKEFAAEELPFLRFQPNAAYYYMMLVSFFLYESFKEDVCAPVVPVMSYPTRLRRELIDFAAKIVRSGGRTLLKVTAAVMTRLNLRELWARSNQVAPIAWELC